jgi:hypothetical protein
LQLRAPREKRKKKVSKKKRGQSASAIKPEKGSE